MKNTLFLLGMTVAVLTSCSKNEMLDMSDNAKSKAIGFNTYVGNTTRAAVADNDLTALQEAGKGFYVHGKYQISGSNEVEAFKGDEQAHVTYSAPNWQYSPESYWVTNAIYKFAAFAPKLADGVIHSFDYTNNQLTITDFIADGKTDLIVAATTQDGIAANDHLAGTNATVNFTFKHALSKVKFTFKDGWSDNIKMTITNISLTNVETKGTLTTPTTLSSDKIANNNWTLASALSTADTYKDAEGEGITFPIVDGEIVKTTYDYEHFFIPQTLSKTPGSEITLTFTISVKDGEAPLNIFKEEEGSNYTNTKTITTKLPTTEVSAWAPGYAYNYNLEISGNAFDMKPIIFGVTIIEEWDTTTEDVNLPIDATN